MRIYRYCSSRYNNACLRCNRYTRVRIKKKKKPITRIRKKCGCVSTLSCSTSRRTYETRRREAWKCVYYSIAHTRVCIKRSCASGHACDIHRTYAYVRVASSPFVRRWTQREWMSDFRRGVFARRGVCVHSEDAFKKVSCRVLMLSPFLISN